MERPTPTTPLKIGAALGALLAVLMVVTGDVTREEAPRPQEFGVPLGTGGDPCDVVR